MAKITTLFIGKGGVLIDNTVVDAWANASYRALLADTEVDPATAARGR